MFALQEKPYKTITADLVIDEFDQWTCSAEAVFAPTSICWVPPEELGSVA